MVSSAPLQARSPLPSLTTASPFGLRFASSGVVTAVVAPRCFGSLCAFFGRFSSSSAPSSFGPSLGPPFRSCEPRTLLRPLL